MADSFIHEKALVASSSKIGIGTRIWAFANIQENVFIGEGCNICDGCFLEEGVVVGSHVTLKNNVHVFQGITLEDDVFCGVNVAFVNDRNARSNRKDEWVLEKTLIKKGTTIGCNSSILCGLTIGEYAFIGAGSVATKDISSHEIFYGNPAVFKGYVCSCGKKLDESMRCSCGLMYEKDINGKVKNRQMIKDK